MISDNIALFVLLSPLAFIITAIASWYQPGLRPGLVKRLVIGSGLFSIIVAVLGGVLVFRHGLIESSLLGFNGMGFSTRMDPVSMIMFSMIAIIAFIVVRFSLNYLDGDAHQGRFLGRLAATIASVQLLVLSGSLGLLLVSWILTSNSLHRLLVFYKDRPVAIVAARKKFIMARLGDISLLGAVILLYFQFETGNLEVIFEKIRYSFSTGPVPFGLELAALLLAVAAIFKSAQFPTHGWLVEVMETPTPVSALLHAGLLNAGPFLLIRMAYVMEATTYASITVLVIGGFTALFASLSFLTQTSIKTALGYSSVAHMGFSLMVCGLGVFPAAMLHLVAHSFYKAHSFLSSGSVIDSLRAMKVEKAQRSGNRLMIAVSILMGLGIYTGFAMLWGINIYNDFALIAIGAIIVMGLSTLFASALDSNGNLGLMSRAFILSLVVAAAFFSLESGMHFLLSSSIPEIGILGLSESLIIMSILLAFSAVTFVQMLAPTLASKPIYRQIALHLKNGLYANILFDQLVGALGVYEPEKEEKRVEEVELVEKFNPIKIKNIG